MEYSCFKNRRDNLKNLFLDKSVLFLSKYINYSDDDLEKLRYGLEGLYLTFTKLLVIIICSIILNIFFYVVTILLLFNIIRYFGFGVHARKSIECLITSIVLFLIIPYVLLKITLDKEMILFSGIIMIISFIIYAPADTVKRPLPNTKKKKIRKCMTILIGMIYLALSIIIKNYNISILFFIAILNQAIVINPIAYILLRQPYNNYKKNVV